MAVTVGDMVAKAATQPTETLCGALLILEAKPGVLPEPERLTRMVLLDVLCERHPEADAAFDAWASSDDFTQESAVPAVVEAALTAAGAR